MNTCGIVAVLLSLVYFATNNGQAITITYYAGMTETYPLWAVVLVPFFTGILAGNFLDVLKRFRLAREIKKLRRELQKLVNANRAVSG